MCWLHVHKTKIKFTYLEGLCHFSLFELIVTKNRMIINSVNINGNVKESEAFQLNRTLNDIYIWSLPLQLNLVCVHELSTKILCVFFKLVICL